VDSSLSNPIVNGFIQWQGNTFAATDNSVFRSTNSGSSWVQEPHGMNATSLRAFINIGSDIYAGTFGSGMYRSSNTGISWQPFTNLNQRGIRSFTQNDSAIFAGTTTDGLYESLDGGITWAHIMSSVHDAYIQTVWARGNTILVSTLSHGAYRSTDNGNSWTPVGSSLTDPGVESFDYIDSTIYASTLTTGFIFRSTDGGVTWSQSSTGLSAHSSVHKIIKSGTALFAAANDGVYRSLDSGATWSLAINGMTTTTTLALILYNNMILVGTAEGEIYVTNNNGTSWTGLNDGLPPGGYSSGIEVFGIYGQNMLCGTYSTGLLWRPLSEIVISINRQGQSEIPVSYSLKQNYPNPFNPSTNIKFDLPYQSHIRITVYDINGRVAEVLADGIQNPGSYIVEWNAANFASGIYFCRFEASRQGSSSVFYTATKKMVLIK
jgi:photosystem II stability/assembly factor-like uncharacterized protein